MRLMTIRQVAERLAVSERTVYREIAAGRLATVRVRSDQRVTEEALAEYLRISGRQPPPAGWPSSDA